MFESVVLDACVLIPPTLCDLLLRLAEEPSLYLPRWSEETLDEVRRNQVRLGFSEERAQSWAVAVRAHFPESVVKNVDYRPLLDRCENDPKDRHVLAAAIHCSSDTIVTANLRDFPRVALDPWGVTAIHPDRFLLALHSQEPEGVLLRLAEMSAKRSVALGEVLARLRTGTPQFAMAVANELGTVLS